jgi:hypothetical protein
LIKLADSASRASQDAERLYIEAGRKLASLKTQYAMRKAEKRVTLRWAAFVKARVGVSKSRANELIQMASVPYSATDSSSARRPARYSESAARCCYRQVSQGRRRSFYIPPVAGSQPTSGEIQKARPVGMSQASPPPLFYPSVAG